MQIPISTLLIKSRSKKLLPDCSTGVKKTGNQHLCTCLQHTWQLTSVFCINAIPYVWTITHNAGCSQIVWDYRCCLNAHSCVIICRSLCWLFRMIGIGLGKYTKPRPCSFFTLECTIVKDRALYIYLHFILSLPCLHTFGTPSLHFFTFIMA